MDHDWNSGDDEWAESLMPVRNQDVRAADMLPARPKTDRTPGVGAKKHFSCAFVHGAGAGSVMNTDSLTEKRVALVLLARPDVVELENQVLFTWLAPQGVTRRHYFDFRATMTDGSRTAIMVKYDAKLRQDGFQAEIAEIAEHVTPDFADRVTLMTEKHLDPVDVFNATLFNSVRHPDEDADAIMREAVRGLSGAARISDLIDRTGLKGRGFRSIARLIAARELQLRDRDRVAYESFVLRRAA
ncbi:hypothetical protein C4N9_06220 [Pararhodobacter marinus]|uniref:Uncharacterized protein n=1 Tax=Pararhodobacter marinus TaxID=2184063 RepID=A0A2U2CEK4_9RHOB|nr:hypothetical protein [Pararhodobacter marinus]PWE30282.1 hypothetical protein C4N9_06220 [Pararhodobacter marinus]